MFITKVEELRCKGILHRIEGGLLKLEDISDNDLEMLYYYINFRCERPQEIPCRMCVEELFIKRSMK